MELYLDADYIVRVNGSGGLFWTVTFHNYEYSGTLFCALSVGTNGRTIFIIGVPQNDERLHPKRPQVRHNVLDLCDTCNRVRGIIDDALFGENMMIAERLAEIRKYEGIPLWLVEKKTNLSPKTVVALEKGELVPSLSDLEKLARCYGVQVDYLLGALEPSVPEEVHMCILDANLSENDETELLKFIGYLSVLDKDARAVVTV